MASLAYRSRRAFSLLELVIVVVILGILAAIAVPRMSRSATNAADNAVSANLAILRNAVDLFSTEHGGTYPSLANLPNALTQYSDIVGTTFGASVNTGTGVMIILASLCALPAVPVVKLVAEHYGYLLSTKGREKAHLENIVDETDTIFNVASVSALLLVILVVIDVMMR